MPVACTIRTPRRRADLFGSGTSTVFHRNAAAEYGLGRDRTSGSARPSGRGTLFRAVVPPGGPRSAVHSRAAGASGGEIHISGRRSLLVWMSAVRCPQVARCPHAAHPSAGRCRCPVNFIGAAPDPTVAQSSPAPGPLSGWSHHPIAVDRDGRDCDPDRRAATERPVDPRAARGLLDGPSPCRAEPIHPGDLPVGGAGLGHRRCRGADLAAPIRPIPGGGHRVRRTQSSSAGGRLAHHHAPTHHARVKRQTTRAPSTRCRNRATSVISGIEMLCPMPG